MSDFEYLSVLIAIIIGIGFAHLLLGIGRILGEAKALKITLVHLICTGNFQSHHEYQSRQKSRSPLLEI